MNNKGNKKLTMAQVLGQVELPSDSTQLDSTLLLSEATELDGQEGSPVREAAPLTLIQHHQERQPSGRNRRHDLTQ
jgi:hypothetical protein